MTNLNGKTLWGSDQLPDVSQVFQSCMGYAATPAWRFIQQEIESAFGSFEGLQVIELGCGLGKVSLLFSLLGANTTLLDYSERQLSAADYVHQQFHVHPLSINHDLVNLPENLHSQFDVAMSFGTAEHFWDDDRQLVFNSHAQALKHGGLAIVWVPNRYGFLFHLGRLTRKVLRRSVCAVNETSFTRKEFRCRAQKAGFTEIQIRGGGTLRRDFSRFIIDVPRLLGDREPYPSFTDIDSARNALRQAMRTNSPRITLLGDLFSYPLVLIGRRP